MTESLESAYDDNTWSRIERSRRLRASPRRLSMPSAAIVASAILAGAHDSLTSPPKVSEVQFVRPDPMREVDGVRLFFVPDAPRSTIAFVRLKAS
ncbi:MAG: hypothetical protein IH940_05285 [Acidobacteria bacterium]|nr:hypothetical protein [Acidobacteriota bacterium]